jgi:hypothetical protein
LNGNAFLGFDNLLHIDLNGNLCINIYAIGLIKIKSLVQTLDEKCQFNEINSNITQQRIRRKPKTDITEYRVDNNTEKGWSLVELFAGLVLCSIIIALLILWKYYHYKVKTGTNIIKVSPWVSSPLSSD